MPGGVCYCLFFFGFLERQKKKEKGGILILRVTQRIFFCIMDADNTLTLDEEDNRDVASRIKTRRRRRASVDSGMQQAAESSPRWRERKKTQPRSNAVHREIWPQKTRETARTWMRRAVTMKYLHLTASQYYDRMSKRLTLPVVFLTAGIGTGLVGIAAADSSSVASTVFTWLLAAVSFCAAGMSAMNMELDPSGLSERHLHKSVFWSNTADDLALELSLIDSDDASRSAAAAAASASWFLPHVQKNMSMAENLPPVLPEWVFKLDPSDVMRGELANELDALDRLFSQGLASSGNGDDVVVDIVVDSDEEPPESRARRNTMEQPPPPLQSAHIATSTLSVASLKEQFDQFREQVRLQRQEYGITMMFGQRGAAPPR